MSVALLSLQGQKALRLFKKYLDLCLTGLDRHENKSLLTEFSFLGELSLYVQLWIILLNIYFGVNLICMWSPYLLRCPEPGGL